MEWRPGVRGQLSCVSATAWGQGLGQGGSCPGAPLEMVQDKMQFSAPERLTRSRDWVWLWQVARDPAHCRPGGAFSEGRSP